MPESLAILMAQINPTVGAIERNRDLIIDVIKKHQEKHDLIIFPEMVLTGYPPEDLLRRRELYQRVNEALIIISHHVKDEHVLIGYPCLDKNEDEIYNAASVYHKQKEVLRYYKQCLPNYGVFDERRYFKSGNKPAHFILKGYPIGVLICEDLWHEECVLPQLAGPKKLMICINASPFETDKYEKRVTLLKKYAKETLGFVYVNLVGGQDELVFDGQSMAFNNHGKQVACAKAFEIDYAPVTLKEDALIGHIEPTVSKTAQIYRALGLGLRDYVVKNQFKRVLVGLSGGIDSALTLCIACDALGPESVRAVLMPSRYTSKISNEDALTQVEKLGTSYTILPIETAFDAILKTLEPSFTNTKMDLTEENIQARIRGLFLMALSNKLGYLVLSTSNKSEAAVGYATLYGDMVGGFSVLKDVLKTEVYALAHYRNSLNHVIPDRVLTRAPSAELRPDQKDSDSLPPYDVLDRIIKLYIEEGLGAEEMIDRNLSSSDVHKVINLIKRAEYKRQQASPGVKISSCAFGRDWRYPLTAQF